MTQSLEDIAKILDDAALNQAAVEQISSTKPISTEEAYEIQDLSLKRRYNRGEILTGYKLGFTSRAKMEQMNVFDVICGRLTDAMCVENNGNLQLSNFIHPRIEPEIAFRIKKQFDKEITLDEATDYIDGIASALEIIDSRYENFKFSLEDVIADNCSSSAYVIGNWLPVDTKIQDAHLKLIINNNVNQSGHTSAILGNPLESLVEFSKMAVRYNFDIQPGMILLAGAATSATYIYHGDRIEGLFERLDAVSINVKK